MLEEFWGALALAINGSSFPLLLTGIAVGFAVGILPGLGGGVALALMLPFTFDMDPPQAFAFLLGMMSVTSTTGDITSVLFGVPGEGTSAATVIDGHAMAKNGEAGRALGAAIMSSLVGSVVGALALAAAIPIVRPLVLSFASPEFSALAIMGLTFVAALSGRRVAVGLLAAGIGLMLSMVGLDPHSGGQRFTFGILGLWDGVGLVPVVLGLFAIPELVELWTKGTRIAEKPIKATSGLWQGVKDTFIHWGVTLRCSLIGTGIGIMPGLGSSIAQWMAYAHAVQSARNKGRFGHGDVRGVLGPGASNNSGVGGALIPTVAFGVPGGVATAILLGAFLIQGLVPGEAMLTTELPLTFSFVWMIVIANAITAIICFVLIRQLVKITYLRGSLLVPSILLLIVLGAYSERNSILSVVIALCFGALGLLMVRLEWPRSPLILGVVLGPLLERNLVISYTSYGLDFLRRPIVLGLLAVSIASVLVPLGRRLAARRKQ